MVVDNDCLDLLPPVILTEPNITKKSVRWLDYSDKCCSCRLSHDRSKLTCLCESGGDQESTLHATHGLSTIKAKKRNSHCVTNNNLISKCENSDSCEDGKSDKCELLIKTKKLDKLKSKRCFIPLNCLKFDKDTRRFESTDICQRSKNMKLIAEASKTKKRSKKRSPAPLIISHNSTDSSNTLVPCNETNNILIKESPPTEIFREKLNPLYVQLCDIKLTKRKPRNSIVEIMSPVEFLKRHHDSHSCEVKYLIGPVKLKQKLKKKRLTKRIDKPSYVESRVLGPFKLVTKFNVKK